MGSGNKGIARRRIKTWKIDVNRIVDKEDLEIGPYTKVARNTEPYTKIRLKNVHRYPVGSAVKNLKERIALMYKWFIHDDEIDFLQRKKFL